MRSFQFEMERAEGPRSVGIIFEDHALSDVLRRDVGKLGGQRITWEGRISPLFD